MNLILKLLQEIASRSAYQQGTEHQTFQMPSRWMFDGIQQEGSAQEVH